MDTLRTPDDRFASLPGFSFAPHYVNIADGDGGELRVHYIDEGPSDASPVLLMHGEPSWSYLYRKMIPILVDAGLRAVAPDLIGFGRSDKPTRRTDYTYQRHVDWMTSWLDAADLQDATLVGQDWGGLIGLRLVAEQPERFARVVAANTFLPTGDRDPGDAFLAWQRFSQETPDFTVGRIVNGGCTTDLAAEVVAAYDAPFPDETYKEGARQFPMLVPTSPDDPAAAPNRQAWEVLRGWTKPFLCAFSDQDPITRGADHVLRAEIPGCEGQAHAVIAGGGHFLQEDRGEQLAEVIVDFVRATPPEDADPSGPWLRRGAAGYGYRMDIIRHDDGSLTVPVAPERETADDDVDAPAEPGATEMVIRPGEGGYNEALAEWDLQQNPDRGESVSTVSGREQAMAVVHAVAEDPDHVAEAVESLDDPEAGAEALRHVLIGGTPSVQAFASEVAEAEGGDELPPHKATKIIGEVLAEIDTRPD